MGRITPGRLRLFHTNPLTCFIGHKYEILSERSKVNLTGLLQFILLLRLDDTVEGTSCIGDENCVRVPDSLR